MIAQRSNENIPDNVLTAKICGLQKLQTGSSTKQPVGINKMYKQAKNLAPYLKLPNPEKYNVSE